MSSETFEEFFGVVKKGKSKKTNEILDFMQNAVLQIAEIVDQLDLKVTSVEGSLNGIKRDIQEIKSRPAAGGGMVSSAPVGAPAPPPTGGGGGLPPLPGIGSPPPPGGGFGGLSSAPQGSSPPAGDRPMSPMMMQANLQNELKAAFKNIRARLDADEE